MFLQKHNLLDESKEMPINSNANLRVRTSISGRQSIQQASPTSYNSTISNNGGMLQPQRTVFSSSISSNNGAALTVIDDSQSGSSLSPQARRQRLDEHRANEINKFKSRPVTGQTGFVRTSVIESAGGTKPFPASTSRHSFMGAQNATLQGYQQHSASASPTQSPTNGSRNTSVDHGEVIQMEHRRDSVASGYNNTHQHISNVERDMYAAGINPTFDPNNHHNVSISHINPSASNQQFSINSHSYANQRNSVNRAAFTQGTPTSALGNNAASHHNNNTHNTNNVTNGLTATSDSPHRPLSTSKNHIHTFLMTPVPRHTSTQCYIVRNAKGLFSNKFNPLYSLFLEGSEQPLCAAKKQTKNRTSNYHIGLDVAEIQKGAEKQRAEHQQQQQQSNNNNNNNDHNVINYLGKVRSNYLGTEFTILDGNLDKNIRSELGVVYYESNIMGARGPRKMTVVIPTDIDNIQQNKDLATEYKVNPTSSRINTLSNKTPRWNDSVGAYVLNFNGRVSQASVKNFQLKINDSITPVTNNNNNNRNNNNNNNGNDSEHEDNSPEEPTIVQFGRVSKDTFTLDCTWPMTPFQAFAIALTSFDYKLACE